MQVKVPCCTIIIQYLTTVGTLPTYLQIFDYIFSWDNIEEIIHIQRKVVGV